LALAKKLLGGSGTIYVFSDFQKSNWESAREFPGGTVCRLRPVTKEPVENVALTALSVTPAEPVAGEPIDVICTVFNCTSQPRQENVRPDLGEFQHEARVTVPPFGSADAVFSTTLPQPGPFIGKATLAPDDLNEDNARYVSVRVNKALQVLLISDADVTDQRS